MSITTHGFGTGAITTAGWGTAGLVAPPDVICDLESPISLRYGILASAIEGVIDLKSEVLVYCMLMSPIAILCNLLSRIRNQIDFESPISKRTCGSRVVDLESIIIQEMNLESVIGCGSGSCNSGK